MYPGGDFAKILGEGHEDGKYWVPAEVDVSIRPGWFWHENQDSQVRTPENLLDLYYSSVGRNSNLLLNVPPDKRGILNEKDVQSLLSFKVLREKEFETDLARGKRITVSSARDRNYSPVKINDGDTQTYWSAKEKDSTADIIIDMGGETEINRIVIQEFIRLGQRVKEFKVEVFTDGKWEQVTDGTTIGYKIIRKFPVVKASAVRLTISKSKACPVISNVELYRAPGE
jgi:alpha-L-fucosidase